MNKAMIIKNVKRILSALLVIGIVVSGTYIFSGATKRTDSNFKYDPFFKEGTDYDVLFFGTSHVINAIFPMQLWNDYGIRSYNFGGHANQISVSYGAMRNAVKYHKPKVVVLDVLAIDGNSENGMDISYSHLSLDAFPLSAEKISAVKDIYPGDKNKQEELIFPYMIYHNKWEGLTGESIKNAIRGLDNVTREKGAESRIRVEANPYKMTLIPKSEQMENVTVGYRFTEKFVEYCKNNDIQPLLIYIPYPASEDAQKAANSAYRIAEKENIPFLNMEYDNLVDFDIDCHDATSHLNPSGARKVTDYLGKYLTEHYSLKDWRGDPNVSSLWNKDYEIYRDFLKEKIGGQTDLKLTLMLLNNENFEGRMQVSDLYHPDVVEQKLIKQLGNELSCQKVLKKKTVTNSENDSPDVIISVIDKKTGQVITTKSFVYRNDNLVNKTF